MTPEEEAKFRDELVGLPEKEIKARLTSGLWSNEKSQFAQIHLEERARARLKAAQTDEQRIAESAKKAARASTGIAILAVIISIIALYNSW